MTTIRTADSSYTAEVSMPAVVNAGKTTPITMRVLKDGVLVAESTDSRMILGVFAGPDLQDLDFWMTPYPMSFPGSIDFSHVFARPGTYRLWLEAAENTQSHHHAENATLIAYADVVVTGEPVEATKQPDMNNGYTLELQKATPRRGRETQLTFTLRNPEGKSIPFIEEEPFMYMFVSKDFGTYVLNHGEASKDLLTGHFHTTFPSAGTYYLLLYSAFYDAGAIRSVVQRFEVTVGN